MRVLLTGASGFLGRYMVDALAQAGIETVVLGRQRPPNKVLKHFIEADLLATQDFTALVEESAATHLLHMAWYAEHGKYWGSPLNLRFVDSTLRLVEAFCHAGGDQVVITGTCAEYDWSQGYCREDSTPLNPATLYGTAKDAARRLAMAVCAQHQVRCAWGRIFSPYGTGESNQRLIPSLMDVFQNKRPPFAVNATAYRDFLHASDVAAGFLALLRTGATGCYNISSGHPVPLFDLVERLARLFDADPQAVLGLAVERLSEPPLLIGENLKLKALGWQPALTLDQGLERTVHAAAPAHDTFCP